MKINKLKLSIVLNFILICLLIYIGGYRTNYFYAKLVKFGVLEYNPTKRPDYRCIVGWTNTLQKLNVDVDVVFFGNSITRFSNFQSSFPDVKICNLGYGGDTTREMLDRVNQIKAVNPEKVFLMCGINDIRTQSDEEFKKYLEVLVDSIKHAAPRANIYIQSILPINPTMEEGKAFKNSMDKIVRWNGIIKQSAANGGGVFVDLYTYMQSGGVLPSELTFDGIHLRDEAYYRWSKVIEKYIY